ncbi:HNHc domain-containing protein [Bacillus sp. IT-79MI2]
MSELIKLDKKVCSKCGIEKPNTLEFFRKARKSLRADCRECGRLSHREWLDNNKEQQKEYGKKYNEENKEKRKDWFDNWNANNKEYRREYKKEYRIKNKESIQQYRKDNKERIRVETQSRRAKKRLLPAGFTRKDWEDCKEYFSNRCCYCGEQSTDLTQEHFIPMNKSGGYTKENMIPSCGSCNSSKKDENFFEWYPKMPFYSKERENKILTYLNTRKEREVII